MIEFYRSARVFDPMYAVTIDYETAKTLIKGLRVYEALDEQNTITALIGSFNRFQEKAAQIQNPSGDVDILQWHHDNCGEDDDLKVWVEACAKVVLVQPSSAAAERVFSLLQQFWGDQQRHAISDTILLSLFLVSYNKRSVEDLVDVM